PTAPSEHDHFYGNQTSYGRLFLPSLLKDYPCCVYLDSDLYVNCCVDELFGLFDGKNIIYASGTKTRRQAVEQQLYAAAKLNLDAICFNSGVMAIDLELWRQANMTDRCNEIARKFSKRLITADQSILNIAFPSSFRLIDDKFNTLLHPSLSSKVRRLEERIYHFADSPKPWDPLGKLLSNHHNLWYQVYKQTAIGHVSPMRYYSWTRSRKTLRRILSASKRQIFSKLKCQTIESVVDS
ncbi:MAG: glycosyltransferase, partial [Verrucomicrobiota bacterium]